MALTPASSDGASAFNGGTITQALTVDPTSFAVASLDVEGDTLAAGSDLLTLQAANGAQPLLLVDSTGTVVFRPSEANSGAVAIKTQEHGTPLLSLNVGPQHFFLQDTSGNTRLFFDLDAGTLAFYGVTPTAQPAAIANAAGGAIIDAEARTALNSTLAALRTLGLIAT